MNTQFESYAVRNKFLANSLSFLTNQRYRISRDVNDASITVYVFERTEILMEAMTELHHLKKKYSK